MSTQGHSESEKIKILYADSLKDIRELTTRLETVAGAVKTASTTALETETVAKTTLEDASRTFKGLANQEMKLAGAAAVAALSAQVGKIAQRVAGDAAATERQRSFAWAAGSMTLLGAATYATGLALGSMSAGGAGWGYLTPLALGAGIISGFGVAYRVIRSQEPEDVAPGKDVLPKPWKRSEFDVACYKLRLLSGDRGMPTPISSAAWDVLSGNSTVDAAASKHNVQKIDLDEAIKDALKIR